MQVNGHRLQSIEEIEARGKELWETGKVDEWLAGCDPKVAKVRCNFSIGPGTVSFGRSFVESTGRCCWNSQKKYAFTMLRAWIRCELEPA